VELGEDAEMANLFYDGSDVTESFTQSKAGNIVTFTPIPGKVELGGGELTAKAVNGTYESDPSAPVDYEFDNKAPPPPEAVSFDPVSGVVTVEFDTKSGQVSDSVKIFIDTGDITTKFTADTSIAGVVKFTPKVGAVEVDGKTLKATVSDKSGNVSEAVESESTYSFDNDVEIFPPADGRTQTFDATPAKYRYTFAEGTYGVNISGFTAGDEIVFDGRPAPAIAITNLSQSDGKLALSANYNGAAVIDVNFSGLLKTDDEKIFGSESFEQVFGDASLSTVPPVQTLPQPVPIPLDNAASQYDAGSGDFAYIFSPGNYATTVKGFGVGDSLSFLGGSKVALSVFNSDGSDGIVLITASTMEQAVDVTLTGLPIALDALCFGVDSFNSVFGAGSLGK
jgi:hypothetical protein